MSTSAVMNRCVSVHVGRNTARFAPHHDVLHRLKSTATAAAAAASCPHAHAARASAVESPTAAAASASASASPAHPELVRVPSLPYVGSLLPFHSGVPPFVSDPYRFLPAMNRKFGNFYSMGMPSIGDPDDIRSTLYVIRDPNEMAKVVRAGGAYPSGLGQILWPNLRWATERGVMGADGPGRGFFGQGEEWRRLRTFLQKDLLHPDAARGYVPGIIKAAELASRGAALASASDDDEEDEPLNWYFSRCAFDMFSSLMFGEMTETADASTPTDEENRRFVDATKRGLSHAIQLVVDPWETIAGKRLGLKTRKYRRMEEGFDVAYGIGRDKIERFMGRKAEGRLDAYEEASYLSRAVDRLGEEGCDVTPDEALDTAWVQLFAAVDTTSNAVAWNVVHLALNPAAQETLREELRRNVAASDGRLVPSAVERRAAPYLHAVLRETHRLTPNGPVYLFKRVGGEGDPVEIHGESLPPGSVVAMEGISASRDPSLLPDPLAFQPERWSDDEVRARGGTPAEILDHLYYRDAFSQGPRKCPGSRAATNEMLVMLSQLVLDWEMRMPEGVESLDDVRYEQRTSVEPIVPRLVFEPRG